jgi:hypothetical protein
MGPNRRFAAELSGHSHLQAWVELAPRLRCGQLVLGHLPELPGQEMANLAAPLAAALGGRLVLWAPEPGA